MMGIGGSGMAAVAYLASKMGYAVSGCDLESQTAYIKNIYKGHDPKHLNGIDLLVVTPAVFYQSKKNPELVQAEKKGIVVTWQEFVGKYLSLGKKVICVAGTHGKSTTTAMIGKLLTDAGLDPTVLVGANVREWGGNARFGNGKYFVIEADEFNDNFLHYHPDIIVLNNIEFDHPDYFKSEKEVENSFDKFVKNLKGEKILITLKDGFGKHFNLKLMGKHNQENANLAYALGKKLGISNEVIVKSLESFEGVGRRMELIADRSGVKIYDDYAHHPTAIRLTLEGLREKYPTAKILAVIEPHGYKRTKALLPKYKGVFDGVDKVVIGPIFKARDEIDKSITPQKVVKASGHKNALSFDSFDEVIRKWKMENGKYNIVVVMGAGKSYLWAKEIASTLPASFSDLTTFKAGGKIKYYFEVAKEGEIEKVFSFAKTKNLPVFILGGGSDILVSGKNFDGVVVKYIGNSYKIDGEFVTAEAGMEWDDLVKLAVKENLQGLEALSGIPGTVGAAPIQNIGAYGTEISDYFYKLEAFDLKRGGMITFTKDQCKFGYRESIFKTKDYWQRFIITSVTLKLAKNKYSNAKYKSLKKYLSSTKPTISDVRKAVLKARSDKLEDPKKVGNAGSFFKNPVIGKKEKEKLIKDYPDAVIFPFEGKFKVSAAWLIEKAGWKGKVYKSAAVSSKHSLILVNKSGKTKPEDVLELSEKIISDIKSKFGIKLEREVQLINFALYR